MKPLKVLRFRHNKEIKCPRIGCDGRGIPVDTKKKFSFGKAAVGGTLGGALLGPPGAVVETMTGVKGKTEIQRSFVQNAGKCLKRKFDCVFILKKT